MTKDESTPTVTGVGVLDRAVAILDAVERTPMGASELARHLGLAVPTTHRLVAAMVEHGLLRRDANGRHHTGWRFTSSTLATTAGPLVEGLCRETGETAQVWVRRGEQRLCLLSAESEAELRASLPVGSVLPLSAGGSAAHVLTGAVPQETAQPERRWFESVSQRTPGLCSVSAAVRLRGEIIAAVGVSAPVSRVHLDGPGAGFGSAVVATAEQIEAALDGCGTDVGCGGTGRRAAAQGCGSLQRAGAQRPWR